MLRSSALKARSIPAWGEAPGVSVPPTRGLKARPIASSIPNIPLVAVESITFQECSKLVLKRLLHMVRLLTLDVPNQCLQVRRSNRKHSISTLPFERPQLRSSRLQPFGRIRLQRSNQLGNRQRSGQSDGQAHRVCYPTNPVALTASIPDRRCKVGVQVRTYHLAQQRLPVVRAEDDINQHKAKRLSYGQNDRSGLQPFIVLRRTPGASPQAGIRRAFNAPGWSL